VVAVARQRADVDASRAAIVLDAHDHVIGEAENERAVLGLDVTGGAVSLRRLFGGNAPFETACGLANRIEDFLGGAIEDQRADLRVVALLHLGEVRMVGDRVRRLRPVAGECGELGRVLGIRRDVVDRRQSEEDGSDARRPCENRKADCHAGGGTPCARRALPPDHDAGHNAADEREARPRKSREHEANGERRLDAAKPVQDEREQDEHGAEQGNAPRRRRELRPGH